MYVTAGLGRGYVEVGREKKPVSRLIIREKRFSLREALKATTII